MPQPSQPHLLPEGLALLVRGDSVGMQGHLQWGNPTSSPHKSHDNYHPQVLWGSGDHRVEWPMCQHYLTHHSSLPHHMNNTSHAEYNAHPDAPLGDTLDAGFNTTELSEQWEKMDHAHSCLPSSHPPLSNMETVPKWLFTMFLLIYTLWTAHHTLQPLEVEAQGNTSVSDGLTHTRQMPPWKKLLMKVSGCPSTQDQQTGRDTKDKTPH